MDKPSQDGQLVFNVMYYIDPFRLRLDLKARLFNFSRNQLSEVPRELCLLPLQVLLLSNNKLTSLPKEIGKMSLLTELDASGNQITQLPMTIGDLFNLRALNLKNNQLGLLPLRMYYNYHNTNLFGLN